MRGILRTLLVVFLVLVVAGVPVLHASEPGATVGAAAESHGGGEHSLTHMMMMLAFQLGVIIIAAKLGGELFQRVLRLPAVLGELAAGLVIGPYALGAALFPLSEAAQVTPGGNVIVPVSVMIYGVATFASIILLFLAGLETDFKQFIRYAGPGGLVGLGGVIGAFISADLLTVLCSPMLGESWGIFDGVPLFMGTISVATSVGITARVLSEKGKLDTPEGVTILAGAVIDDVLGIIVLAIVIGIEKPGATADPMMVAAKAVGIWLAATGGMILLAKPLKNVFGKLKGEGVVPGLALGIALLLAGLMESAGLAMIIGAYVAGLALAKEQELAHRLDRALRPMYNVLVPVFFCTMGMLVSFKAMEHALVFGLLFSVVAIFSKILGCGLPTLLVKFNLRGAARVGIGMLPRGEVALIVAGVGLTAGLIDQAMFGVSIMMTLITTVMAPPLLVRLFEGGPGLRGAVAPAVPDREVVWRSRGLPVARRNVILNGVIGAFRVSDAFGVSQPAAGEDIYLVSSTADDFDFEVVEADDRIEVHASTPDRDRALADFQAALATAKGIFEDIRDDVPGG